MIENGFPLDIVDVSIREKCWKLLTQIPHPQKKNSRLFAYTIDLLGRFM